MDSIDSFIDLHFKLKRVYIMDFDKITSVCPRLYIIMYTSIIFGESNLNTVFLMYFYCVLWLYLVGFGYGPLSTVLQKWSNVTLFPGLSLKSNPYSVGQH